MDSTSSFTEEQQVFPHAERLQVGGTTCECYRVKLYGKLHFLKRLKPQLRTNPKYAAVLQKEFETGYNLDHPHLVRYVGKTADGVLMDYVDGETLGQFVSLHPDYFRNRKNANRFVHQLLSVVGYLHERQIVHLDLKPENILITRVGNDVKLIDLGFCYTDSYTDTMGRTDKYAAPEQKDGSSQVDARTDIYTIGRILQILPCADFYKGIIRRCTAQEPEKRFQSVDEIEQTIWLKPLKRRILLSVGILLTVVLLLIFFWNRSQDTSVPSESTHQSSLADTVNPAVSSTINKGGVTLSDVKSATAQRVKEATDTTPATEKKTDASPVISYTLPPLPDSEIEKRIRSTITPIFQRVMGSLRNAEWNDNTRKIYYGRIRPLNEQCGSKIQVLWTDLSRHYDIDERNFYQKYSQELIALQNDLYERMVSNGK
ncbi:hypothetical protein C7Y71_007745 [Pseudoprevotella muciniphila]|uniref:Protein kinase domain-containing protein n=1 Tax=Pseudoprevotella muciniphila TaxID=2133944 RepID=A0A5P8E789_9BACT|nr:protein kinase [Pseudoprevotella muciniphila]QFQ12919.1 hypothetical protein C7Y71_007745 [Pseudoprevotella muciniphila]